MYLEGASSIGRALRLGRSGSRIVSGAPYICKSE